MWNYVPNIATVFLALLQLAKDWGAHETHWRRALVLIVIVLLGLGGAVSTHYTNARSATQHLEDQKQISGLRKAVETANANQEANTKQFVGSFKQLSQELGDLQTQVKTANLQKEAAQLKKDLEATQKALKLPKAELVATVGRVTDTLDNIDVKETSAQRGPDGTVAFTVFVVNRSHVQATNGSVYVRICEGCMFSEEPERFIRPVGAERYDREFTFQMIGATETIAVPLKIKPPATDLGHRFEVGVTLRCENCTVEAKTLLHISY